MNRNFIHTRNGQQLKRAEKIKLLQDIKDGKESINVLSEPKHYAFVHNCDNPGIYEASDGRKYNEQEYKNICATATKRDTVHTIYFENYSKEDIEKIRK